VIVRYTFPSRAEATYEVESTLVSMTPRFVSPSGSCQLGTIQVISNRGQERHYILEISGKHGRVSVTEVKCDEPEFDRFDSEPKEEVES
jgi:hypothetical protein